MIEAHGRASVVRARFPAQEHRSAQQAGRGGSGRTGSTRPAVPGAGEPASHGQMSVDDSRIWREARDAVCRIGGGFHFDSHSSGSVSE